MIRRFFSALRDPSSPLRRAIGPAAAVAAVVLGLQYLQAGADFEGRLLVSRRERNDEFAQVYHNAHEAYLAMCKAIADPTDADAVAAVPENDTLVQLSTGLVELTEDAGDVFPDTTPKAS